MIGRISLKLIMSGDNKNNNRYPLSKFSIKYVFPKINFFILIWKKKNDILENFRHPTLKKNGEYIILLLKQLD